jgi:hypothetical protein
VLEERRRKPNLCQMLSLHANRMALGLKLFGKMDALAHATGWAAAGVAAAALYWTKLVKESFHNKTEALAAVKACYTKL